MGLKMFSIGRGFINPFYIPATMNNARRTRVYQIRNMGVFAGFNNIFCANNIGTKIFRICPPYTGFCGYMENNITALNCGAYLLDICNITTHHINTEIL